MTVVLHLQQVERDLAGFVLSQEHGVSSGRVEEQRGPACCSVRVTGQVASDRDGRRSVQDDIGLSQGQADVLRRLTRIEHVHDERAGDRLTLDQVVGKECHRLGL